MVNNIRPALLRGQFTGWAVLLTCLPRAREELLVSTPRVWELGGSSSRKSSTWFWRSNLDLVLVEFVFCMSVLSWDKNYDDSPLLPSSTDISIKQALRKSLLIESNHRSCGIAGHSRVLETRIWFHSSQAASGYLLLSCYFPHDSAGTPPLESLLEAPRVLSELTCVLPRPHASLFWGGSLLLHFLCETVVLVARDSVLCIPVSAENSPCLDTVRADHTWYMNEGFNFPELNFSPFEEWER